MRFTDEDEPNDAMVWKRVGLLVGVGTEFAFAASRLLSVFNFFNGASSAEALPDAACDVIAHPHSYVTARQYV